MFICLNTQIDILVSHWYHFYYAQKIRQLIKDLEAAGFINRGGKGSHRNFIHPNGLAITLSGKLGDDAKQYQEREVQLKIQRSRK